MCPSSRAVIGWDAGEASIIVAQSLTPPQLAMIVAGVILFSAAAFATWQGRRRSREEGEPAPARFSFPWIGEVSAPTRVVAGLFGMLVGYHLVVWAFPATLTPMQLPRGYWWAVLVLGVVAVGLSLLIDILERRPDGGKAGGERGGGG